MPIENFESWNGGECPVPHGVLLDILHRDLEEYLNVPAGDSWCRSWGHSGVASDVIGFRFSRYREAYLSLSDPVHITSSYFYDGDNLAPRTAPATVQGTNAIPSIVQGSIFATEPEPEVVTWQEREANRFKPEPLTSFDVVRDPDGDVRVHHTLTGEFGDPMYKALPDNVLELMLEHDFIINKDHYLHQALHNKSHVSYTEDSDKGAKDRQTSQKLGKYIKKFAPDMPDHHVASIAALYRKEMLGDVNIKFARTREEIRHVYENGPSSCMGHDVEKFSTGGEIHPVEVYATPDIAVAYTERDGRINARAVCNMIQNEFSRIYGDHVVIAEGLEELGYSEGGLTGCHLLKLECDEGVIAPYLDGDCNNLDILDDSLLITADGSYEANSEHGILNAGLQCNDCGDHHNGDNMHWSDHHEIHICGNCITDYSNAYNGGYTEYLRDSEFDFYEFSGELYTQYGLEYNNLVLDADGDVLREHEAVYSEIDSGWYSEDDVSWYKDTFGDVVCTRELANDLVQPEDEEHHMLESDCYEYDGKYYRQEENKTEAENEYEENSKEVA